jgi:hypothetical protein
MSIVTIDECNDCIRASATRRKVHQYYDVVSKSEYGSLVEVLSHLRQSGVAACYLESQANANY